MSVVLMIERTTRAVVRRKLGVAAAAGALAVSLTLAHAACGGDGGSGGVASLTDTTGQTTTDGSQGSGAASAEEWEQAALAYAKCMREHGIDFPDPVNGGFVFRGTPDEQKMEEADRACRPILDRAERPLPDAEALAEKHEAMLEFARCMREHGVDVPDPQGELDVMPKGAEEDPDFEEAQKACQPILDAAEPDNPSGQGS